MSNIEWIGTDRPQDWHAALNSMEPYDFYHLPGYHQLAEQRGEGEARLLVYRGNDITVAIPLLIREINQVPGLEMSGSNLRDATSVYGYVGLLASQGYAPRAAVEDFQQTLTDYLRRENVVSLFSRNHPLIGNLKYVDGLGQLLQHGQTVSIDLTASDGEQVSRYRSNLRYDIRKLRKSGLDISFEHHDQALQGFREIYNENMRRIGAEEIYFFDDIYFRTLFQLGCFELITCRSAERIVAGAIFSKIGEISQYHLSATEETWLRQSPMKLVIDTARTWAANHGSSILHLGGGLGSDEDMLFRFKAGFSPARHRFSTWRWEIDPAICAELCELRSKWKRLSGLPQKENEGFFPKYRG